MMMEKIPCAYHKTTLVLVDNDEDFVIGLSSALRERYKSLEFTVPQEVIEHFKKQGDLFKSFMNRHISKLDEVSNIERLPINIA